MTQGRVENAIRKVLPFIRAGQDLSEDETRENIIDPVLRSLGWEPGYGYGNQDEHCTTEYYPYEHQDLSVDYAMFARNGQKAIIIEAEKLLENTEGHCVQLTKYTDGDENPVGVLTNGAFWNICRLDRHGRPSEEKLVSLASRPASESAERLFQALSKSNWH